MENFQPNIDDRWEMLPKDFSLTEKIFPLVFHHDYDKYTTYENSNKIIAPKSLLYSLSKYEDLNYPIHLELSDHYLKNNDKENNSVLTIMDFNEDIDAIYLPNKFYQLIDLDKLIEFDNYVKFNIINKPLEKATNIAIKPFRSTFYQIKNPKEYLEIHLKRNFTVLKKNQIISLIYRDTYLDFDIVDIFGDDKSEDSDKFYSLIDTEITLDLQQPYDYVEPASFPKVNTNSKPDSEKDIGKKEQQRFPGKGNKLGSNKNIQ